MNHGTENFDRLSNLLPSLPEVQPGDRFLLTSPGHEDFHAYVLRRDGARVLLSLTSYEDYEDFEVKVSIKLGIRIDTGIVDPRSYREPGAFVDAYEFKEHAPCFRTLELLEPLVSFLFRSLIAEGYVAHPVQHEGERFED